MIRSLLVALLLAFAAGLVVPFQASANSQLAKALGHPFWAATFALALAAIMMAGLAVCTPFPERVAFKASPAWMWLGGGCSVLFVCATIHSAPRLGAGLFSAVVFGGQLLAALIVDQTGSLGFPQRSLTASKAVGATLVIAGVAALLASEARPRLMPHQ